LIIVKLKLETMPTKKERATCRYCNRKLTKDQMYNPKDRLGRPKRGLWECKEKEQCKFHQTPFTGGVQ
jgi:uncharacterized protein with PIN domain